MESITTYCPKCHTIIDYFGDSLDYGNIHSETCMECDTLFTFEIDSEMISCNEKEV